MKRIMALVTMMMCFSSVLFAADVSPWVGVGGEVLVMAIQVLAPVILAFISWAAWKLVGKLGIEKNVAFDIMLRSYVKDGINWADSWANEQANKPSSEDKYAEAASHVLGLLKASSLPALAEDKLKKLIESQLTSDKKAGMHESRLDTPEVISE